MNFEINPAGNGLIKAIQEDLTTEPTGVDARNDDVIIPRMLENILWMEEEHSEDMKNFLEQKNPARSPENAGPDKGLLSPEDHPASSKK